MKDMQELKEMLCKELEEYSRKGKMSAGDLETIHKLTDTIKNIDKIEMLEDGGYSEKNNSETYPMDGNSMRGRRRDRRGRFSRNEGQTYSFDDGKTEMIEDLEDMMRDVKSEREREAIRRCLDTLHGMA